MEDNMRTLSKIFMVLFVATFLLAPGLIFGGVWIAGGITPEIISPGEILFEDLACYKLVVDMTKEMETANRNKVTVVVSSGKIYTYVGTPENYALSTGFYVGP
jgi:hypothetical protein